MTNFILWLLFGALVGWGGSVVMRTDYVLQNVIVGIFGAMIGGFVLGGPTLNSNTFNLTALLVSFASAVILLAVANFIGRSAA